MPAPETTLEERLLNNALDTVAANLEHYDPVTLIHLVNAIAEREDTQVGLLRVASKISAKVGSAGPQFKDGNPVEGMLFNYLSLPEMQRRQLQAIQALQEQLMPVGMLKRNGSMSAADSARLLTQCTSQMEKLLRMTKAVRANAEVTRLREAIGKGLEEVAKRMDKEHAGKALDYLREGMRASLQASKTKLDEVMKETEELGG